MAPYPRNHAKNNCCNIGARKRSRCTPIQLITLSLVFLVLALLLTAFHLMQRLAHRPQRPLLLSPNTIKKLNTTPKFERSFDKVDKSPYDKWPEITYDPANTPGVLRKNGAYAKNRVYCMIPFIWRKDFYDVIMATWGKRCDQIYFFSDAIVNLDGGINRDFIMGDLSEFRPYSAYPPGTFPDNVIFINMTRGWDGCTDAKTGKPKICRHIWEKMWRSWIYVADHHVDRAEWFCKLDYDTFFFPENLQYYVQDYKKWDAKTEHHYFGSKLFHRNIIAGPCVCWSQKTVLAIADVYRKMPKGFTGSERNKCEDRSGATEEVTTSKCLRFELGVEPEDSLDDQHRDFVMVDLYENHLEWNRTKQGEWWFWEGKEKERGQMEECCASRPIAFHQYKYPGEHQRLDMLFYGPEGNKDYLNVARKTQQAYLKRYVDKVRKAMGIK